MRRIRHLAIVTLVILLGLPMNLLTPASVFAQTGCDSLTSPLTTQVTVSGSICSWAGPFIISGSGSLILQNSQLLISNIVNYTWPVLSNGVNETKVSTTPGYITLNGSASLLLESGSTVQTYALRLNQTSSTSVSENSNLNVTNDVFQQSVNVTIILDNVPRRILENATRILPGSISLLDSSKLSLDAAKLSSYSLEFGVVSSMSVADGSSVFLGGAITDKFFAGTFSIDSSHLTATGNTTFIVGGSGVTVSNSVISIKGFSQAGLNGTTTTITGSTLGLTNDARISIGSGGASTSTAISGSTLSISSQTSDALMPRAGGPQTLISGTQSLSVTNSNVTSVLSSSASPFVVQYSGKYGPVKYTDYPNSTLSFIGGAVSIQSSEIASSAREYYGFQPNSQSVLLVNASSTLNVASSQIVSGQNGLLGTFANSTLTLLSYGDNNITQSYLQSEAGKQSLVVQSLSPTATSTLTLNQDKLETGTSSGMVGVRSSYLAVLDRTFVDANATGLNFKASAFRFDVVDSVLNIQNLSKSTVFGPNIAIGNFVNTTLSNCAGLTCFKTSGTGSYAVLDYLLVHVVGANSQPAAGATVTATSTRVPFTTYTSSTDQTGLARILAVIQSGNGTLPPNNIPYYIVQGSDGGLESPQVQLLTTGNMSAQLQVLLPSVDFTGAQVVGKSVSTIASNLNLVSYPHLVPPAGQYALGNYIGAQYIPYFYVLSNAVPIGFRNNATNNEIDFSTIGPAGGNYKFVLIYPSNLTQVSLGLRVDGNTSIPVTRLHNSTTTFVLFSMPSGAHTVALTYFPPNGNYGGGVVYPRFFPPASTIAALMVVLAAGLAFAILFVRRREKRAVTGPTQVSAM